MIGIYCITNSVNKKRYIGQSWNIERRWRDEKYGMCNAHLKSAFKKYGIDNFEFRTLIELDANTTQQRLDDLEEALVDIFDTRDKSKGYNKKGAGSRGKHSEETLLKMRKPRSDEARKNMHGPRNRKPKQEKKSKAKREPNPKMLRETKGNSIRVRCTETGEVFESAKAASISLGRSPAYVTMRIRAGKKDWVYFRMENQSI